MRSREGRGIGHFCSIPIYVAYRYIYIYTIDPNDRSQPQGAFALCRSFASLLSFCQEER